MRRTAPLIPLLLGLGCAGQTTRAQPDPETTPKAAGVADLPPFTRIALDRPDLHGASGLTRAPDGRFFTVLERDHRLFELAIDGARANVVSSRAVIGAPGGVDLESVAFLDDTHLVFGTETTRTDRTGDTLLFAQLEADKVVITGEPVALEYGAWGITPERNRGIEGLCVAGRTVVAAVETAGVQGEQRFAPVATLDLSTREWTLFRVGLTSETGKISGLTCRAGPSGVEVLALERHYEVSRIVAFTLPAAGGDVMAEVLRDIAPLVGGDEKIPNFEGIAVASDGAIVSISDNDYGGITGPTELLVLPAPTAAPSKGGAPAAPTN